MRIITLILLLTLAGCASLISSATSKMAASLSAGILNQNDPETVRTGAPAYLLMIDGFINDSPDDRQLLLSGSKLYGSYAGVFVKDEQRAGRLAQKAFNYALRALCEQRRSLCEQYNQPFDRFVSALSQDSRIEDVPYIYGLGTAWAGLVQARSKDWAAVADLPKITAIMEHVVSTQEGFDEGGAHVYLGVLLTLRPPSMGGKPDEAKAHFERAIALSHDKNLMTKILFAKHYARLVYDRALHDKLLNDVLTANPEAPGLTLMNVLAQAEAQELKKSANDYF